MLFRTQKARGVDFLCKQTWINTLFATPGWMYNDDNVHSFSNIIRVYPWHPLPPNISNKSIQSLMEAQAGPKIFARPCPKTPRHGFVESRGVATFEEVAKVIMETFAADKDAEIIFMNRATAKFSMVMSPNALVVGKGNDGATGGKGVMLRIATPKPNPYKWNIRWSGQHEYPGQEVIYVEIVEDAGKLRFVQARPGPMVDGLDNFIPKETTVSAVITRNTENLLEWEAQIKALVGLPGIVVWDPGSSLTSHFAVHCLQSGIPYVTAKECPKVGDVLKPSAPPKMTKMGRQRFKAEVEALLKDGFKTDGLSHIRETALALGVAHAHSIWGNDVLSAKLRARAFVALIRYSITACIGEARHFWRSGPGRAPWEGDGPIPSGHLSPEFQRSPTLPWSEIPLESPPFESHREAVYSELHKFPMDKLVGWAPLVAQDLSPPGWHQGMGGEKWADAASRAVTAWTALQNFLATPEKDAWNTLTLAINQLAFAVHNNGAILNKFLHNFTGVVATFPVVGLAAAAPIILELMTGVKAPIEGNIGEEEEIEEPLSEEEILEIEEWKTNEEATLTLSSPVTSISDPTPTFTYTEEKTA